MRLLLLILTVTLFVGCENTPTEKAYVDFVDPLIGSAPFTSPNTLKHSINKENNSQVVPYVTAPFAMTNWTAETKSEETKCVAPYYYTDSVIQGFRGSHWISGSCVQEYGSMTIMPIAGELKCMPEARGSAFSHDEENATPYLYEVRLQDYDIDVKMTATARTGLFKFTYNKAGDAHIIVNPNSDEGQGFVRVIPERNEIVGYNPVHRIYQGWGEEAGFSGYFVVRFDRDITKYGVYHDNKMFEGDLQAADLTNIGAYVSFVVGANEDILANIGTSFTSIDQARKNLDIETERLHFNTVVDKLKATWEAHLSTVKVEGESEDDKIKFYTSLYHSSLHPRTFNDCDGSYMSFAGGKEQLNSGDKNYYVDFSMWDTYRALHPLLNLLEPSVNADMMHSLLAKAEQGGWLPIFPCWNSYTSAMIGDHVIATIADAYMKGVIDLTDKEYAALLQNAFKSPESFDEYKEGKGRRGLKSYLENGFIPLEDEVKESYHDNEQVSRTLEYAYDDYALSQVAAKRGDTKNAEILRQRALNYKNVYSAADSCMRGKYIDGTFTEEFDKMIRMPYITEGTPYQYTWYVPHDVAGLMNLMGGEEGFNANLDNFHAKEQYWHGNEPGHQIPFLYNYSGQPWKTQELVTEIMETEYITGPGGLSGNDDAGQMSAWYAFAAMGFYPVCPSVPEYIISGPHFDKITIELENGKQLVINAPGASTNKNYIQSLKVDGVASDLNYINHFDLMKGGTYDFVMGETANKEWGTSVESRPTSLSK